MVTYQELLEDGRIDSLIDKSRRVPNLKNHVDDEIEKAVPDYAAEYQTQGQVRTSCVNEGTYISQ